MYHITKNKERKFYAVLLAGNGEVLSTSELFTRKESVWKNIAAQLMAITIDSTLVQDDTAKKLVVTRLWLDGDKMEWRNVNPKPIYIQGKNYTRKKKK